MQISLITEEPTVTATVASATNPVPNQETDSQYWALMSSTLFPAETLAYRLSAR